MARKCKCRKKDGARCSADAQIGKDVCIFHDPEKAEDGRRARRVGGINSSRGFAVLPPNTPDRPLANPADVSMLLADSINQLRRGELDPRIATAIGYLASVQLRSFDQGYVEGRLAKIEQSLGLLPTPQLGSPETKESEPSNEKHRESN